MTIAVFVLTGVAAFCVGYLARDLIVEWPRRVRGGDLDLTGWRQVQPRRRSAQERPLLFLVPGARGGSTPSPSRSTRRPGERDGFYSAAWLDERRGDGDRA